MSGGHYNYLCYQIEDTYTGELESPILEELLQDFCHLLKSLEWYKSSDTSQEEYQDDVTKFLNKWINSDTASYLKGKNDIIMKIKDIIN